MPLNNNYVVLAVIEAWRHQKRSCVTLTTQRTWHFTASICTMPRWQRSLRYAAVGNTASFINPKFHYADSGASIPPWAHYASPPLLHRI